MELFLFETFLTPISWNSANCMDITDPSFPLYRWIIAMNNALLYCWNTYTHPLLSVSNKTQFSSIISILQQSSFSRSVSRYANAHIYTHMHRCYYYYFNRQNYESQIQTEHHCVLNYVSMKYVENNHAKPLQFK